MPAQAYALVTTFMACSVVLGIVAIRLLARAGGPTRRAAYLLPIVAGFGAFYLIGHKLGISVGPEIELYGFQVALLGDLAIGLGAALIAAALQTVVVRRRAKGLLATAADSPQVPVREATRAPTGWRHPAVAGMGGEEASLTTSRTAR